MKSAFTRNVVRFSIYQRHSLLRVSGFDFLRRSHFSHGLREKKAIERRMGKFSRLQNELSEPKPRANEFAAADLSQIRQALYGPGRMRMRLQR